MVSRRTSSRVDDRRVVEAEAVEIELRDCSRSRRPMDHLRRMVVVVDCPTHQMNQIHQSHRTHQKTSSVMQMMMLKLLLLHMTCSFVDAKNVSRSRHRCSYGCTVEKMRYF